MSKVSKRQEIKEKEALQARFQLALKQQSAKVLSWLPTETQTNKTDASEKSESRLAERAEFLNLPIILQGSGLFELENEENSGKNGASTIGSFISSEETKKIAPPERKGAPASKAMSSLMNKMRGDTRRQIHEREREKSRFKLKEPQRAAVEPESDEELKLAQIQRKVFKPAVGGKKKARPF